jgi:hypothetical protein
VDGQLSVQRMTDEQLLATFGTAEDPVDRGFDDATQARVLAYELVRARSRVAFYRTLYASFIEAGQPYMIENLAETGNGDTVPVKLTFTDDATKARRLEERSGVTVWTEPELLDALTQERAILDFFTTMLGEFVPALQAR